MPFSLLCCSDDAALLPLCAALFIQRNVGFLLPDVPLACLLRPMTAVVVLRLCNYAPRFKRCGSFQSMFLCAAPFLLLCLTLAGALASVAASSVARIVLAPLAPTISSPRLFVLRVGVRAPPGLRSLRPRCAPSLVTRGIALRAHN